VVEESPKSMPPGLEETSQASFQSQQGFQETSKVTSMSKTIQNTIASYPAPHLASLDPMQMRCDAPSFVPDPVYIAPPTAGLTQVDPLTHDTWSAKEQDLDSADDIQKGYVKDPPVLRIADGLEIISIGSLDHGTGKCKPCTFINSPGKSCQSGAACLFCHMCPPSERKLRKKSYQRWKKLVAHQHNATITLALEPAALSLQPSTMRDRHAVRSFQ